jgi:hypothetical protein
MPERTLIQRCVIFGASGDLASRYLLPALAELWAQGKLPPDLRIVGVAREKWDDATFRRHVAARTAAAGGGRGLLPDEFLRLLRYEPADITNHAQVQQILAKAERPQLAYLAIPPALFMPAVDALAAAGADAVSHVVVEKPFGTDQPSDPEPITPLGFHRRSRSPIGPVPASTVARADTGDPEPPPDVRFHGRSAPAALLNRARPPVGADFDG